MKKLITCCFISVTTLFIISCGGGSDSESPVPPRLPPPESIVEDILGTSVTVNKLYHDGEAQLAGTSKKPRLKLVFCSVYKFINPPACSNAPQKIITIIKDNKSTKKRSLKTCVSNSL